MERRTEMEWISVKDRLPPPSDSEDTAPVYWVYVEGYGQHKAMFIANQWWYNYMAVIAVPVTHWMPLPEPPRPDKEMA